MPRGEQRVLRAIPCATALPHQPRSVRQAYTRRPRTAMPAAQDATAQERWPCRKALTNERPATAARRDGGLMAGPAGLAGAAVAVLFLFPLVKHLDGPRRLERAGLAGDGQAALGVRAHLIEGGFVRSADLLAVGAGFDAGIDLGTARGQFLPLTPTLSPRAGRGSVAGGDGAV